jgi:pilus assembly protein CpaD
MRKILSLTTAAAALLALAACADTFPEPREPKAPVVQQMTSLHAVRFAPEGFQLSEAEAGQLLAFLAEMRLRESDRVLVEVPAGAAAGDPAYRRALAVMQFLARNDVQPKPFSLPEAGAQVLRVGVERIALHAPADCPDWPVGMDFEEFVNDGHPNHGCATANNFAVMLANPRDAVEGRELGPIDTERMTLGVTTYRKGDNLPYQPLPAQGGT